MEQLAGLTILVSSSKEARVCGRDGLPLDRGRGRDCGTLTPASDDGLVYERIRPCQIRSSFALPVIVVALTAVRAAVAGAETAAAASGALRRRPAESASGGLEIGRLVQSARSHHEVIRVVRAETEIEAILLCARGHPKPEEAATTKAARHLQLIVHGAE